MHNNFVLMPASCSKPADLNIAGVASVHGLYCTCITFACMLV